MFDWQSVIAYASYSSYRKMPSGGDPVAKWLVAAPFILLVLLVIFAGIRKGKAERRQIEYEERQRARECQRQESERRRKAEQERQRQQREAEKRREAERKRLEYEAAERVRKAEQRRKQKEAEAARAANEAQMSERRRYIAQQRRLVTDRVRYDVLTRDGQRCVICGASAKDGVQLHVDHIIPLAKGGTSDMSNLRTLCERCNLGKGDRLEVVRSGKGYIDVEPDEFAKMVDAYYKQ